MSRTTSHDLLIRAAQRRGPFLARHEIVRLFDGEGDGIPNLWIDKFGACLVVHVAASDEIERDVLIGLVRAEAKSLLVEGSATTVYLREHFERASVTAATPAQLITGPPIAELTATEWGIRYLLRPADQVNVGLFVDTRDLRARLLSGCAGVRVLNLFAFTGSLGLAAWVGGADEVVQVDVSRGVLAWAKENLALNLDRRGVPLTEAGMRFIAEDAREFVSREGRRSRRRDPRWRPYGVVIIDPPSFGSATRGAFSLRRELSDLVSASVQLVEGGGRIIVCANSKGLPLDELTTTVQEGVRGAGRQIVSFELLTPPKEDFCAESENGVSMRGIDAVLAPLSRATP